MSSGFARLLTAGVWELTAEAGKRFVVHEDVLAAQSQRLKDIIDAFTAAEPIPKRELPLDNWDADTVGRFVEFIYTGDYQSPDPVAVPSTPAMTPTGSDLGAGSSNGNSSGDESPVDSTATVENAEEEEEEEEPEKDGPLTPLTECFPGGPDPPRKPSAAETFAAKYFDPAEHDFEEVFLAHAKVYALAQEFDMLNLQTLAVQRLLRTFINIQTVQGDWPVAANFVELARHAYGGSNTAGNDLRHIVSQFAALNFTALQTEEMKSLIAQAGGFARDLTEKVFRRLVVAEKSQDKERKGRKELRRRLQLSETELREERWISATLKKKVETEKKASPNRPTNPLADRKAVRNDGSVFANIPPPPPNRIFPGTNTFGTTTKIFEPPATTTTTTTTTSVSLVKKPPTPLFSTSSPAAKLFPTSSTPGAKSIFDNSSTPGAKSIFDNSSTPGAKSIFDTTATPSPALSTPQPTKRTSSSFGLFDTPPRPTNTISPIFECPPSVDPVKQPTPFSKKPTTSAFGAVERTQAAMSLFGDAPNRTLFPRAPEATPAPNIFAAPPHFEAPKKKLPASSTSTIFSNSSTGFFSPVPKAQEQQASLFGASQVGVKRNAGGLFPAPSQKREIKPATPGLFGAPAGGQQSWFPAGQSAPVAPMGQGLFSGPAGQIFGAAAQGQEQQGKKLFGDVYSL